MLDFIFYTGIITLASFISYDYNFFLKLITLDSLFSALHFMKTFINKNLTESQVVLKSNNLYNGSLLDKYIYYMLLHISYKIFCTFLWIEDSYILYYIGLLSIIPIIINKILASKLFQIIREKKELIIKITVAKLFVTLTKFSAKNYLDRDINIKYTEILILLKDYKDTINYFLDVLKNIGLILLLTYIKNYSQKMYYGIIKYVYNYKTGDLLQSYNTISAKQHIISIIDNKKWYELTKANTYKAILHLYQVNNDKSEIFKKIVNEFNFSLIKMFTLWTFASLLNCIYFVPFGSLIFILHKKYIRSKANYNIINELVIIFLGFIISYFYNSYVLISGLCQFGSKIIFNKLTYILIKVIYKFIKKTIINIVNNNKNMVVSYLITIFYTLILNRLNLRDGYIIICLNMIANIFMSIEVKKQILFGVVLTSTYLSNFNLFHVLFNSLIVYIINGLFDKSNIYTPQDLVKIIIDICHNGYNTGLKTFKTKITGIYTDMILIVISIKNKIKNIKLFIMSKKNKEEFVFELMNTDKFPSMIVQQHEYSFNKINYTDSVTYNDKIFDQPEDLFIDAISISDDGPLDIEIKKNKDIDSYFIINDYLA
jgi:hypothetical protein